MAVRKDKIRAVSAHPSPRKLKALKELSMLNFKVSSGYEYGLHERIIPGTSLKEVQKILSKIKEPMSDFICRERDLD